MPTSPIWRDIMMKLEDDFTEHFAKFQRVVDGIDELLDNGRRGAVVPLNDKEAFVNAALELCYNKEKCQAYSNGTYGTKVKKAIEYNEKGCNIQIVKEKDFFNKIQ